MIVGGPNQSIEITVLPAGVSFTNPRCVRSSSCQEMYSPSKRFRSRSLRAQNHFPAPLVSYRSGQRVGPEVADRILRVKKTNGAPTMQAQPRIQKQSRKPKNAAC
jgi:hypothetical protein